MNSKRNAPQPGPILITTKSQQLTKLVLLETSGLEGNELWDARQLCKVETRVIALL